MPDYTATPGRRPSIRDVAAAAAVSSKTVSNVLHGHPYVTESTRARVQAAIDALGYRPDLFARGLRGGRSGLVTLAVEDLAVPYFAELASLVVESARERGYTVLVDQTRGDRDRETALLTGIAPLMADGVILSPEGLDRSTFDELRSDPKAPPIVLLGEHINGSFDHVLIDNTAAAYEATQHLVQLGRRRIAAIGADPSDPDIRLAGYRRALADAGLAFDADLVTAALPRNRSGGAVAMSRLLELPEPPDAVFCLTDLLALGAVRASHDAGLRVPGDVAVVGFDDIEGTRSGILTITTIAPDKVAIAENAVRLVHERISGERDSPTEIIVPYRLAIRESTAGRQSPRPRPHCKSAQAAPS